MKTFSQWMIKKIATQAKLDITPYSMHELILGMKEELEHGKKNGKLNVTNDDPVITLKIALAHLKEDPHYYTKLKRIF